MNDQDGERRQRQWPTEFGRFMIIKECGERDARWIEGPGIGDRSNNRCMPFSVGRRAFAVLVWRVKATDGPESHKENESSILSRSDTGPAQVAKNLCLWLVWCSVLPSSRGPARLPKHEDALGLEVKAAS
jgi:hypothetical protein